MVGVGGSSPLRRTNLLFYLPSLIRNSLLLLLHKPHNHTSLRRSLVPTRANLCQAYPTVCTLIAHYFCTLLRNNAPKWPITSRGKEVIKVMRAGVCTHPKSALYTLCTLHFRCVQKLCADKYRGIQSQPLLPKRRMDSGRPSITSLKFQLL